MREERERVHLPKRGALLSQSLNFSPCQPYQLTQKRSFLFFVPFISNLFAPLVKKSLIHAPFPLFIHLQWLLIAIVPVSLSLPLLLRSAGECTGFEIEYFPLSPSTGHKTAHSRGKKMKINGKRPRVAAVTRDALIFNQDSFFRYYFSYFVVFWSSAPCLFDFNYLEWFKLILIRFLACLGCRGNN